MSSIFEFVKNLNPWRKKEEPLEKPFHWAEIIYSESAVDKGVLDEFQKKIRIWKNGKIIDTRIYSYAELKSIRKTYNIPIVDRTKIEEPELEFQDLPALSGELVETIRD